jgi:hypothetical protein
MSYTDIQYLKDLNIEIYGLLNKKADYIQVQEFLEKKVNKIIQ